MTDQTLIDLVYQYPIHAAAIVFFLIFLIGIVRLELSKF